MTGFISGSIIDIISFILEVIILFWFFEPVQCRSEDRGGKRRLLSALPLILLLIIYLSPLNAAVSVFSIRNLGIQFMRMLMHLVPVTLWLILRKGISADIAAYLAGLFTAIYLTAQNLRMIIMTYGITTPPRVTTGAGYVMGLLMVAFVEFILSAITRSLIKPEKIDIVDRPRVIMMSTVLLIMVYFKWIFTAVRELSLGGSPTVMVSFSLVTSIGLYLVILLFDYSRRLLKEKQAAEQESMVLQYEVRSAKREMQASDDIKRLYHDVKNHLLAIRSMAGSEGEINEYLSGLLPQFEGYETQVSTGNEIVDAILSEKIQLAYADGIRFNVCLDLSDLCDIKTVDLVTIFGNAVDNATEALRKLDCEEKYLYIKSSSFANNIIIRFENRFDGRIEIKNGVPLTSKKDASMHGIGVSSIRNTAERYGGSVSVKADHETHLFTLTVMIPASGK